jgi:NitT/TauT family transport system permease protein
MFAVLAHVALVLAWYLFVKLGNVPKFVMPSPGATLDALLEPNYSWWTNIAVTGTEIFAGYFLALLAGVALALFPNTIMAFSICVFPILLTTARGLREIEPELLDLVRSLKGSRWQLFSKVQLPGALPYIFSGMKVAAILAVAGAIVGEFLGSDKGLGYLMLQVQVTLDTPAMFMAVIMITLIGMLLYGMVLALERWLVVKDARLD